MTILLIVSNLKKLYFLLLLYKLFGILLIFIILLCHFYLISHTTTALHIKQLVDNGILL